MLRAALLNPPVTTVLEEEYDRPDFPRPVLAVLAGYLRKRELPADLLLVDSKMERLDFDEVVERTTRFEPHIIGITAFTNEIDDAAKLGKQLEQALPEAIIVIGEGGYRKLSPSWKDYNKQVGGAVEMQNLTRRQMEFLQFIGYNWVFIRNGRLLDWFGFMWHYRRAGFSLVRTLLRPRARRVERRDAAHVFFDDLLEVKNSRSEQESLGG